MTGMRNQTTKSRKYNQFGDAENMIDEKVERVQLVKEKLLGLSGLFQWILVYLVNQVTD